MAKPNNTRIAPASKNASTGSTPTSSIPDTPPPLITHPISPANAALIRVLEALIGKLKTSPPDPVPPRHARLPHIKPRRRVTVSTSPLPATDDDIPRIRLCGHWLVRAGFGPCTRVRVHVAKECMILLPEDKG